ncbi:CCA tRNA nucleotidyltransferase [Pelagibacterium xiamenense]|uniref:CCA tRNA nucleotidyltransferase n=1 Tax=Pelagibacterium xiamenense TaxID=2901140 RepID=UPI001E39BCA4|nr:CCA tRNA nucleotidyltransferase [Pelagibacterium xiamenense]MCD7060323.1 CCA tRNA nucleotidyltransferase [Pelagibacterium xiamenense]
MSRTEALERLANAGWLARAAPFFACLDGDARATRAVGGIVRDTLLGIARTRTDLDLATTLLPEEVMARAKAAGLGAHPTGLDHGTVTLVHEGMTAEVTTLRKDVETYGRHARVVFGTDWRADAARRDFTMNALYAGGDGVLFDPLAGLADCLARRVRFIGDPRQRLAEDRLRVYRYFRFCASHGEQRLDADALAACAEAAQDLSQLSAERVGQEMTRLLALPRIGDTLSAMIGIGLAADLLDGGARLGIFRRYESVCPEPALSGRLAIVLSGGIPSEALQARWRLASRTVREAGDVLAAARGLLADRTSEVAYRWPDAKRHAVYLAAALGDKADAWVSRHVDIVAALDPPSFPVDGRDLMALGFAPGEALGAELDRLKRVWIERDFVPDKAALLALAAPPEGR